MTLSQHDYDQLMSCLLSLQTMHENLANNAMQKGDNEAQTYFDYIALTYKEMLKILK